MTTTLPREVFIPVPLRWRHVTAGDVMVSPDGDLWLIVARGSDGTVAAMRTSDSRHSGPVDPDDVVSVLIPVVERDAVELTRDQLGARLMARRTEEAA